MKSQCLENEMEYKDWRECPQWYCIKTILNNNDGTIKRELVSDEKTKIPIVIQGTEKPLDGVYETTEATTYYTYHRSYEEDIQQLATARI